MFNIMCRKNQRRQRNSEEYKKPPKNEQLINPTLIRISTRGRLDDGRIRLNA